MPQFIPIPLVCLNPESTLKNIPKQYGQYAFS